MRQVKSVAVKLKRQAEKKVKQGHPWVYESSIEKPTQENVATGSLCVIFDHKNDKPFAFGLWDAEEMIRIKIIHLGVTLKLNADFWTNSLKQAREKREKLLADKVSGFRAIHGENDRFPGLVLDIYAKIGVLKLYSKIWMPYLEDLMPILQSVFDVEQIVIRLSRKLQASKEMLPYREGELVGKMLAEEKVLFEEYGIKFYAYAKSGHKTGFFLDQRPNRLWVQKNAANCRILDVFSYTGGFSVHALKGGASSVVSIDISNYAMEVAAEHVALNQLNRANWHPIIGDAFEKMDMLIDEKKKFDIVIIDPPAFAKQAKEIFVALKQYERLARLGADLVAKGGYLVLGSCSSRISLTDFTLVHRKVFLQQKKYRWHHIDTILHDIDHPITFEESHYLKTIIYQLRE